ncbi:fungal-specific transcription factor domain-containing protein [Daldinia bambusicola]|nr:fungal-specific transcription factor domain-containing protein [Daldinia bambusicola]
MASQQSQQQQSPLGGGGGGGGGTAAAAATGGGGSTYKRASRKGAPRRFSCDWPGCDKIYSRAEHLQRHQLNHAPKTIYTCDVPDCTQTFVRPDLLARHKKRHSASYIPRNRTSSFSMPNKGSPQDIPIMPSPSIAPNPVGPPRSATFPQQPASAPRNAAVLLTSDSPVQAHPPPLQPPPMAPTQPTPLPHSVPWTSPINNVNIIRQKAGFYGREQPPMHDHPTFVPYHNVPVPTDANEIGIRENFGVWLFDPPQTYRDFSLANIPFLEGGLESLFNNNIHYDHESLTSPSQLDLTPPWHSDMPDELISEYRRVEVLRYIKLFYQKQNRFDSNLANLMHETSDDIPGLSLEFLRDCMRHYWDFVSPRLPIVHQPTFSSAQCSILLLLVMIALGAAQIYSRESSREIPEYKALADLIISNVRFEILTADEASPPVDLWVAQALLLVEFYEKMYSSRNLHERAHVYHSVTLTLLRRGSPLIGGAGTDSPSDEQNGTEHPATSDARAWWVKWARTESMHRVVFAAFMMDIIHAAMFGHAADMAPHEIRLPLPCDESLWSASSPETVRHNDSNFRLYGVKPVSFLDGLKCAIHGKEVRTHAFGRMIIMCGLLSVGWHLRHRDTHLKWLELGASSSDTRDKWCNMLLKAFDDWKTSFDVAIGSSDSETDGPGPQAHSNGLIQSASVLYHLAHISLYIDIVDCQVYTGAKRLLGRKVSTRDYTNVVARMSVWSNQMTTRHAILHAFKLLHRILVDPRQKRNNGYPNTPIDTHGIQYSCRRDPDPHRPWIMYYATLSIWSFVRALTHSRDQSNTLRPFPPQLQRNTTNVYDYLCKVTKLSDLDTSTTNLQANLQDGLSNLLDTIGTLTSESPSELLKEACGRLDACKHMLYHGDS